MSLYADRYRFFTNAFHSAWPCTEQWREIISFCLRDHLEGPRYVLEFTWSVLRTQTDFCYVCERSCLISWTRENTESLPGTFAPVLPAISNITLTSPIAAYVLIPPALLRPCLQQVSTSTLVSWSAGHVNYYGTWSRKGFLARLFGKENSCVKASGWTSERSGPSTRVWKKWFDGMHTRDILVLGLCFNVCSWV